MDKTIILMMLGIVLIYIWIAGPNRVEGLNTFTGRMAVEDQYFYDKLFDDVYYYPNESDGTLGITRCRQECPGHCVEYGIGGNSHCFNY